MNFFGWARWRTGRDTTLGAGTKAQEITNRPPFVIILDPALGTIEADPEITTANHAGCMYVFRDTQNL